MFTIVRPIKSQDCFRRFFLAFFVKMGYDMSIFINKIYIFMKILRVSLMVLGLMGVSVSAKAGILDSLVLEAGVSIEYAGVEFDGNGNSSHFENKKLEVQLKEFENVALGLHFRVHKYFGLNINWAQADLDNSSGLNGVATLSTVKPELRLDYTNYSALFFYPFVEDSVFEGFLELGVSDMYENLTYTDTSGQGIDIKDHQSNPFIGLGINYLPFEDSLDSVRFTAQGYINKINTTGADFYGFRVGYVKYL